ncbi:YbdK family carboxylate-amine ligase [Legionella pneumophila]|uniref:YbdK family carboxylate-amine ligase n=1 Tax=Legionella pneumophila TaxID=446 RepID=UPI000485998B|nr:YbdK family carboxylate-amine ligase [Legionella pneumophila]HAT1942498.1 glutamate--cysteine ligase [Legionella pneumophila]HAT3861855.1 glutamate--cysteine ligase [Legionella pneumophila]HAT8690063.1 glutamate--cysteine ligase [Legionella pneumophila]HAT8727471.1 glutamate--cysteine ligase [Legionella pneumophila]HAU1202140.1 glutamate--cysteine ligase [Legionella pneumophila]
MPLQPFKTSNLLTMGVELELQLISLSNFDLTAASPDILELLGRSSFPGSFTPEITESMLEIATDVHEEYDQLLKQLFHIRDALVTVGDRLNIGICGGGTHPFQMWSDQRIFNKTRFLEVSELYGYLTKQFTIFGQHIHIGCEDGNQALFLLHSLNRYIPHFIALSASSPFVQSKDTLYNSARLNSVFAFPLSGRAPFVLNWDEFSLGYFEKMEHTGIVKSMKDFYWDLRPKPEFGTIEMRVCDSPLTVERAAALACYMQALCSYLLENKEPLPHEDDYLVYNYNRFQACRFGLDGTLVHPKTYEQILLREDILTTLRRLKPYANQLNSTMALEHIYEITHKGSDASFLREKYAEHRTLESVVNESLKQFRSSK